MAAAAGGYLISRLALEGTVYWVMRAAPVDLGDVNLSVPAADWRVAVFLVVAATAATALFALMPALQATRIEPVRTLRGELVKDARPGRARNALIGVQVFASALLLICAAIFLRSGIASSRFDPGLRTADTVLIDVSNEPKRAAMLQAIATEPTITAHAALRPGLMVAARDAFADTGAGKTPVGYKYVSAGYFDVLGIPIVRGRSFTAAERDEHPVVIVSESIARALWPNRDGVGETFRLEEDLTTGTRPENEAPLPPRMVTVVGVSRDVPGFRFTDVREADIFVPTSLDAPKTSVVARVNGDPDLARQTLLDHLTRIDPNMGMIVTMRTLARDSRRSSCGIAFWVSLVLGGLALLLTVSGLFSVLSYLVEQRTREIGVRMALGASARQVTQLILSQATRPVMYGLLAGAGLAATLATALIATPDGALHRRDRAHHRSGGLCGQPDRDHRRLPGRRLDPRHARGARRSDADAAPEYRVQSCALIGPSMISGFSLRSLAIFVRTKSAGSRTDSSAPALSLKTPKDAPSPAPVSSQEYPDETLGLADNRHELVLDEPIDLGAVLLVEMVVTDDTKHAPSYSE